MTRDKVIAILEEEAAHCDEAADNILRNAGRYAPPELLGAMADADSLERRAEAFRIAARGLERLSALED
jgi:hypothetical protein